MTICLHPFQLKRPTLNVATTLDTLAFPQAQFPCSRKEPQPNMDQEKYTPSSISSSNLCRCYVFSWISSFAQIIHSCCSRTTSLPENLLSHSSWKSVGYKQFSNVVPEVIIWVCCSFWLLHTSSFKRNTSCTPGSVPAWQTQSLPDATKQWHGVWLGGLNPTFHSWQHMCFFVHNST